jgi:hypothetical protein
VPPVAGTTKHTGWIAHELPRSCGPIGWRRRHLVRPEAYPGVSCLLYQYGAMGEKGLIAKIEQATIRSVNAMALSTIVLALQTWHVVSFLPKATAAFRSSLRPSKPTWSGGRDVAGPGLTARRRNALDDRIRCSVSRRARPDNARSSRASAAISPRCPALSVVWGAATKRHPQTDNCIAYQRSPFNPTSTTPISTALVFAPHKVLTRSPTPIIWMNDNASFPGVFIFALHMPTHAASTRNCC